MTKQFLGSADENESEEEQLERELNWKEEHSCNLCGDFECDGSCESEYGSDYENHEDTWYDYAEKSGRLESEGAE